MTCTAMVLDVVDQAKFLLWPVFPPGLQLLEQNPTCVRLLLVLISKFIFPSVRNCRPDLKSPFPFPVSVAPIPEREHRLLVVIRGDHRRTHQVFQGLPGDGRDRQRSALTPLGSHSRLGKTYSSNQDQTMLAAVVKVLEYIGVCVYDGSCLLLPRRP